ncbi:MAG: DUF2892 domain-containing protein [Pseudomonadota bacterium]
MKTNIGGIDRIVRVVAGLVLLGLALGSYIGPWGYVGLVPLATAAVGWCPLYTMLGIKTCPHRVG